MVLSIFIAQIILLVTHVVRVLREAWQQSFVLNFFTMKIKRKSDHFNFFFPKLCMCFCYLLTSFCNYWEINLNKLLIFIHVKMCSKYAQKLSIFFALFQKICSVPLSLQSSFNLTEFRYFLFSISFLSILLKLQIIVYIIFT